MRSRACWGPSYDAPRSWCWDNSSTHHAKASRELNDRSSDWLTIAKLPSKSESVGARPFNLGVDGVVLGERAIQENKVLIVRAASSGSSMAARGE